MRILHVFPRLKVGGVEFEVLDFVRKASQIAPEITHFVAAAVGPLTDLLPVEVKHIALPLHRKDPFSLFLNGLNLARLVKAYDIDLIHARSRGPCWSALLASRLAKVPWVSSIYGAHKVRSSIKRFYNSGILRAPAVISTSAFLTRYVRENYPSFKEEGCLVQIPTGIDVQRYAPEQVEACAVEHLRARYAPHQEELLLMPARFTAIKGHELLLEALSRLMKRRKSFRCLLIGPIEGARGYVSSLKRRAQALGLEQVVAFEGAPADLRVFMRAADVVIAPSVHPEAFGRVVAEACALESLVIASDLGGFQEILADSEVGWKFFPSNPDSLAETLERVLLFSLEERQRIGRNARARIVKHFSLDRVVADTFSVYRSLVKG